MKEYLLLALMWAMVAISVAGFVALVQIARHIDRMLRDDEERRE